MLISVFIGVCSLECFHVYKSVLGVCYIVVFGSGWWLKGLAATRGERSNILQKVYGLTIQYNKTCQPQDFIRSLWLLRHLMVGYNLYRYRPIQFFNSFMISPPNVQMHKVCSRVEGDRGLWGCE